MHKVNGDYVGEDRRLGKPVQFAKKTVSESTNVFVCECVYVFSQRESKELLNK